MRYRKLFMSTGIALACAGAILSATASAQPLPLVAAHRGGALLLPENTLPAFRNAASMGVQILEFDMNLTADDQLVVMHDTSVNPEVCMPLAGAKVDYAPIRQLTLAQMREFDCGSRHRAGYASAKSLPGTRVTTLDEILSTFRDGKVLFFGETKIPAQPAGEPIDPVKFARLIEAGVRKYGLEDRFILQSSDYRTIDAMHDINPRIRTCLVRANRYKPEYLGLARAHHAGCEVIPAADIDATQVRELQANDVWVFGDVADNETMWREHEKLGVHAIITNDPAGLIAFEKGKAQGNN